jgi:exonuclease-1
MYRVRLLKYHGITPIIVFDGGPLPAKKGTEVERAAWVRRVLIIPSRCWHIRHESSRREFHSGQANALAAQGRHREARDHYTKCVDITPEMALQLIKVCKSPSWDRSCTDCLGMDQALKAENVDYVVAPYEADAQMAFMEREGLVDGIITEDSDMLVFGCRSVRIWSVRFRIS